MGLDIGDRRIGLALSDPLGVLATPLTIIDRAVDAAAIERIADIIRKNEIGLLVAGLPLNMDGSRGFQAEKTRAFVEMLGRSVKVPVAYRDERLTTVAARGLLKSAGKTDRETRYDAAAAALILQGYLDEIAGRHHDVTAPH